MPELLSRRTIGLQHARSVLDAAVAAASDQGVAVCICVCDRDGIPVLSARMDGAPQLSIGLAADKAWSVAAFNGLPTHAWWDLISGEPALIHGITKTPRLAIFGGGMPITSDEELVGAVGISGGSAEQDRAIAEAAAAAVV